MKKILLITLILSGFSFAGSAQDKTEELNCLEKYKKVFTQRGSDHVPDGMHRNVVVAVTDQYGTGCFYGKARVEGTKVTSIFIKLEDETYDLFETRDFRSGHGALIRNGISDKLITKEDNRGMQVIFVENIKPKKKQYMKAPGPDPDDL